MSKALDATIQAAVAALPSRVESDSMPGELTIAEGTLWGAQTQRSLQNFPIGDLESRMPLEVVKAMAVVKKCCANYNAKIGKLDADNDANEQNNG